MMPRPFLEALPREIRDQIYTYVLTTSSGSVGLAPWSHEVARSLSILRTCKQIHREVKDVIWVHHGLRLAGETSVAEKFAILSGQYSRGLHHLDIELEIMDRDELQWILHGLRALAAGSSKDRYKTITLRTIWERPRGVAEYKEFAMLRKCGQMVDGRLYHSLPAGSHQVMRITTGWPRISHWGKQKWLKAMLLDPDGLDDLLRKMHAIFGGELHVDRVLCFKDNLAMAPCNLDPRDGEVRIVPGRNVKHPGGRPKPQRHRKQT